MARRRTIRFTIAEDDYQVLLMLARTERKNIEDLFRDSIPEVMAKYSLLVRLSKEPIFRREPERE
jgi:hypothetical protein